jgi:hypothetical protein
VQDGSAATGYETPVSVPLAASDADGPLPLELRIVDQPAHGRVGLVGNVATYFPDRGFAGTAAFTFAAWDGHVDSNLGEVAVQVAPPEAPPPVPDGASVEGDMLRIVKLPGGLIRIEWDVLACPSPGYHLVWYDLTAAGGYLVTGLVCAAGGTGEWVGTPPSGAVAVVVVPDDLGSVEGSHGVDSFAVERPSTAAACGFPIKRTDAVCE